MKLRTAPSGAYRACAASRSLHNRNLRNMENSHQNRVMQSLGGITMTILLCAVVPCAARAQDDSRPGFASNSVSSKTAQAEVECAVRESKAAL